MCCGKDCKGITLLKGNGIVSTVDNFDGTFTINYSDGSTFTTSDFTGPIGATGPTGPAGTNGTNGTNAFKFVLEELTYSDASVVIPYTTWTGCSLVPEGCLAPETLFSPFTDIQIQVWSQAAEGGPSGPWRLLNGTIYLDSILIDEITGEITVVLTGGVLPVLIRIVILG